MDTVLHVLFVEDVEIDAELVLRQLEKSGFEIVSERVETSIEMKTALNKKGWDLVIADYSLPRFDAPGALKVLQDSGMDIPFIVVSGTIGEETAVALMKAGADDYLMKDKLTRLGPAVRRELADAKARHERKIAEELRQESENKYRKIFENIQDVFYRIDNEGRINEISPSIFRFSGYLREELIGKQVEELYHDRNDRNVLLKMLSDNGEVTDFDVRLISKSGNVKWASLNVHVVIDGDGRPAGLEGSMRDVTQRKQIETALNENEEKYRQMVDLSPDGVIIHSGGMIVFANPTALRLMGASTMDQILNKPAIDFVHPDYKKTAFERIIKIFQTGEPAELREEKFIKLNHETIDVEVIGIPITYLGKPSVQTIVRDISHRKLAEKELFEKEQRYRTLFELSPNAIVLTDLDAKIIDVNESFCKSLLYSIDELLGQNICLIVPKEHHPDVTDHIKTIQSGIIFEHVVQDVRKDGTRCEMELRETLISLPDGRQGILTVSNDLTERKLAEENLRKLSKATEQSPASIVITKPSGEIEYVNPKFTQITGYTLEEAKGKNPRILKSGKTSSEEYKKLWDTISSGHEWQGEFANKKKNGEIYYESAIISPITGENGLITHYLAVKSDITEQKLAREALAESEERFRHISSSKSDVSYSCKFSERGYDLDWMVGATQRILGYSVDELINMKCWGKLVVDEDFPLFRQHILDVIPGKSDSCQLRLRHKNGNIVWIEATAECIEKDGNIIQHFLYGGLVDITARKNTLDALKESEEKFRTFFEKSPIGIEIYGADGVQIDANKASLEMFGIPEKDYILGFNLFDGTSLSAELKDKLRSGEPIEYNFSFDFDKVKALHQYETTRDGIAEMQYSITPLKSFDEKSIRGYLLLVQDITEQKQAEVAIRKDRILLRTLIDNLPDTIYVKDAQGRKLLANRADVEVIGFSSEEEILGKTDLELFNNEIGARGYADDQAVILNGKPIVNHEENFFDSNSKLRWLLTSKIPLFGDNGTVTGLVGIGHDITNRKLAEEARREIEQNYQQLFENISQGFALHEVIIDDSGKAVDYRFISVNPAFENLLNIKSENIVGKTVMEVFPDTEQYWIDTYGKVALTGEPLHFENLSREAGKYFEVWAFSPKKMQFASVFSDITERKRSEQIQKVLFIISNAVVTTSDLEELIVIIRDQLGQLLDTTNFFVALYDEKTGMLSSPLTRDEKDNIMSWPAEKSLTGYVIKHNKSLLVTKEIKDKMTLAGEIELIGTSSQVWLGVPLHMDGKVIGAFAVQSYTNPYAYNEKDVEMLEFVSDQISISIQRKKAEQDIKKALKKAEESDNLKTAFLNNMSHEIRTPLNGIMGFSSLLDDGGISDEERRYYTRIIHQNGNQLTSIIEAIISIATIEAGLEVIRESQLNINTLFGDLFNHYNTLTDQQAVLLNYKTTLTPNQAVIYTDEGKLKQILNNLIGNAVKFTDSGQIEFGCTLVNNLLQFYVSDTGLGIHPDNHEIIFERFRKVNPDRKREFGGNGLGLTISKAYIELLGGKIWLESVPHKGSVFYFTIPFKPVNPEMLDVPAVVAKPKASKSKTLLVAEDEYSNFQFLEVILLREEHHIIHVLNGKEAIEACHNNPEIDMVLMDLKMPEMDGFIATKIIKEQRPDLPVIAVTAYALSGDKEKALNAGCDEYIAKPIRKLELLALINKY